MNGHELSYAPAHLGGAGCTVNDNDFRAALAALFDGTTTEMGPLRFGKWWVGRRVYEAYHEDGEHSLRIARRHLATTTFGIRQIRRRDYSSGKQ